MRTNTNIINFNVLLFSFLLSVNSFSQVAINSTGAIANTSAMLDVSTTNKGILIPRVALTSTTVASPITSPALWLIVFNTAIINDVTQGMYYWNGSRWVRVLGDADAWRIFGNAGTSSVSNFIGTIDNVDLHFRTNNTEKFVINTNNQFLSSQGASDQPIYTWNNFLLTGIYSADGNSIDFSTNGGRRFQIDASDQLASEGQGTQTRPTYSWLNDDNTGIYIPMIDILGITTGGTEKMRIDQNGNVNIGIQSSVTSAALQIDAGAPGNRKGFLIPNLPLTSTIDAATIPSPATSLLVYNTTPSGVAPNNVVSGYYYNSNTPVLPIWKRFAIGNGDAWITTGNSGTDPANNFVGTTDNMNLRFRTNNANRFEITNNNQLSSFNFGIASRPTFSWDNAGFINTGIYLDNANAIGFSIGATERVEMNSNSQILGVGVIGGSDDTPTFSWKGNTNTGIYNSALNTIGFTTNGINRFNINSNGQILSSASTNTAYSWQASTTTGLTNPALNTLGFRVVSDRFQMNSNGQLLAASAGSLGIPIYSWQSEPTLGMYQYDAQSISFASSGNWVAQITGYSPIGGRHGLLVFGYNCSLNRGAVFGINNTPASNGTNYNNVNYGIKGEIQGGRQYSFGFSGYQNNQNIRSGSILGSLNGVTPTWASLGYYTSGSTSVGVYSNSASVGVGGGYTSSNIASGLTYGGYSDFIGSVVQSEIIGEVNAGKLMASYNVGNVYTSGYRADVVSTKDGLKEVAFAASSTELQLYTSGSTQLSNGGVFVPFEEDFKDMLIEEKTPTITVSAMGDCNGIYVSKIEQDGFWVKEMDGGNSSVAFSWIAIGERIDQVDVPQDILKADFDKNISNVAPNENDPDVKGSTVYWNGKEIIFNQEIPKIRK